MLMTVRYPIHFGADPPTCDRHKDAILSYPHRVDVPEISRRETHTVVDDKGIFPHSVVSYDGRLFRRGGLAKDASRLVSLTRAFENTLDRNAPYMPLLSSSPKGRPIAAGMWNRLAHRLHAAGGRTKEEYAWPPAPYSNSASYRWTRNEYLFENYIDRAGQIDASQFGASQAEIAAEGEKLIVIDDYIHVETTPLAWCVGVRVGKPYVGVYVTLAHLPEWLDADLDRQYFPISQKQEALNYAESLDATIRTKFNSGIETADERFDTAMVDMGSLEFDHQSYSLNRSVMLMASDVMSAKRNSQDIAAIVDAACPGSNADLEEASNAAVNLGVRIEDWRDVGHCADNVVEAWTATKFKKGWIALPSVRSAFARLACERTLSVAADMPINLHVANGPGGRP